MICANITQSSERLDPGVAKFGIALEWGSRGLEFESRHSDQKGRNLRISALLLFEKFWGYLRFLGRCDEVVTKARTFGTWTHGERLYPD